jgi:hypothetical protein
MTRRAVLCPHPPLLFRELAGLVDAAAELRAACRAAVADLVAGASTVTVVGGADAGGPWDPALEPDVRRFGTTGAPGGSGLPLSLGVGRRLLDEAGWTGATRMHAVAWDAGRAQTDRLARAIADDPATDAVLVLGEGSTRRGQSAPGFLDDRAFGFDDALAAALAAGDVQALSDLDAALAEELMVLGRPAVQVLAGVAAATGPVAEAVLDYRDDPFGVTYLVARWRFPAAG